MQPPSPRHPSAGLAAHPGPPAQRCADTLAGAASAALALPARAALPRQRPSPRARVATGRDASVLAASGAGAPCRAHTNLHAVAAGARTPCPRPGPAPHHDAPRRKRASSSAASTRRVIGSRLPIPAPEPRPAAHHWLTGSCVGARRWGGAAGPGRLRGSPRGRSAVPGEPVGQRACGLARVRGYGGRFPGGRSGRRGIPPKVPANIPHCSQRVKVVTLVAFTCTQERKKVTQCVI